ncbi:MAG: PEGA domain-containing protein [Deltaproteobacteria bacterium]|nr:PEGA domain-containing protein [Deltaproteobacteria bacterium]
MVILRKSFVVLLITAAVQLSHPVKLSADAVEDARMLTTMGMNHFKDNEFEKAFNKFISALKLIEGLGRKDIETVLYLNLGMSTWKLGRLIEAKEYFEKYIEYSDNEKKKELIRGYLKQVTDVLNESYSVVEITTNPPGATIVVEDEKGEKLFISPFSGYLPLGLYWLVIKKDGFVEIEEKLFVKKGATAKLDLALKKLNATGFIELKCSEPGADIYVDGEFTGQTPKDKIEVREGQRVVKVYRQGFDIYETSVEVKENAIVTINAELKKTIKTSIATAQPEEIGEPDKSVKIDKKAVVPAGGEGPPSLYGWIAVGTGAALIGGGIAFTVSAMGYVDKIKGMDTNKPQAVIDSDYKSYKNSAESKLSTSYIFYGIGAAAIIGGATYLLFFAGDGGGVALTPVISDEMRGVSASIGF